MGHLVMARDYVREVGYSNTCLVADFADVPPYHGVVSAHFEMKSKEKILNWAHGLIFVFLKGCDINGVSNELTFVDTKIPNMFHSSIVLREHGVRLKTMIDGIIVRQGIDEGRFATDKALCELAEGGCLKILHHNYWVL